MNSGFSKTGIYMRLSRDDDRAGESVSIEHQRMILTKYVQERGGVIVDEYIDDGWSGTDFDRPDVKRLLSDAQAGKIDTIVVKDLSRFGRNYIQVGQYIDYIFPAYGIRFIAINDRVDTLDRGSAAMDMMPIMNVFNEWHAASTSKKIRAVLQASQRAGKYTNWSYPYGYRAGTDDKRTAVVDEAAADIVRRIYDLRLRGLSAKAIAKTLTDEGIPNPATYFTKLDKSKREGVFSARWAPQTVRWILSNPTYLGHTLQHRTTSVSYKNHKTVNIPKSEWIVNENVHEPIISKEVWDKVQASYREGRGRADKAGRMHPLSGRLVCPDCGKKLKFKCSKGGSGYFVCRTYADLGKQYCLSHRVSEKWLEELVLTDIRSMLSGVKIDEAKLKERFLKERERQGGFSRSSDEKQLKACKARIVELDQLIQAAFEEKVLHKLPESALVSLCNKYQAERESVLKRMDEIEARLSAPDRKEGEAEAYLAKIKRYTACGELTREACLQLIDFITVGAENVPRDIHIYYKFQKE